MGGWLGTKTGSRWSLFQVNIRIKMINIIVLKLDSMVDLRPDSGWSLTQFNLRIKMIIAFVLKSDSRLGLINQARVIGQVDHWLELMQG